MWTLALCRKVWRECFGFVEREGAWIYQDTWISIFSRHFQQKSILRVSKGVDESSRATKSESVGKQVPGSNPFKYWAIWIGWDLLIFLQTSYLAQFLQAFMLWTIRVTSTCHLITYQVIFGNQLQTLDDKSINIGNNGLHGPLIRSCPEDETSSEGHERIEYKINDQPEACYGVVVEFLGVCSNLHFMKSSTKYTTCNNYGKERQIGSEEHSAEATFEHEKISSFFLRRYPFKHSHYKSREYSHMSIWESYCF